MACHLLLLLELSMVDGLVCFFGHNETSKENQKPRVPSWQWYFKGTMCSESCAGTYLTNKSCPAPSESVSPVSPVRPNRECRRFPTRVGSVSAVRGMLSLRVSMQVDGRCATDGNQDVECSSLTRWCVIFTALEPAATCDIYQVQPEHAMLTGKLHAQARWSDSVSVFPISLSPAFLVGQQVWGLKCLTGPKSCIKPWWDNTKYSRLLRYSNNTNASKVLSRWMARNFCSKLVQKLVRRNAAECLFFIWSGQCWNPHAKQFIKGPLSLQVAGVVAWYFLPTLLCPASRGECWRQTARKNMMPLWRH